MKIELNHKSVKQLQSYLDSQDEFSSIDDLVNQIIELFLQEFSDVGSSQEDNNVDSDDCLDNIKQRLEDLGYM